MGLRSYLGASLSRRLFAWFGVAILLTGATVTGVVMLISPRGPGAWKRGLARVHTYVVHRLVDVWDDPVARDRLARATAEELQVGFTLEPSDGTPTRYGAIACRSEDPVHRIALERDGVVLGHARICHDWDRGGHAWRLALILLTAGATLWGLSLLLARRIVRPLAELVTVADDIGSGKLDARVDSTCHVGEFQHLSERINEMASRIEKQIADQRELLAAVSHEIRTPLGHMRILVEMAQDLGNATPESLRELELELTEMDGLVDELLASSRLEFDALTRAPLDAGQVAARALERFGLDLILLAGEGDVSALHFEGDPTLIARALANLIHNALRHADGPTALTVRREGDDAIAFVVDDAGPGLPAALGERVFDPFYRGDASRADGRSSLGLGLALVSRIARAHGGRAWTVPRESGARVCFSVRM